ncbi:MarR family winged helix-turn-helix transcriptional regulator [Lacticaseibacillus jixianensis]|uniref:MarR family winged helix-turn-helix transcriptional regulator n=1 Tax=Lacticaseibacillus jixianensis TaxID=2486012 RepID=A0ABW4BA35_9LACO|nr:MarR family winged helix-turn-helix transcriptional regulator [Lacticaseibacillus jixianensis]
MLIFNEFPVGAATLNVVAAHRARTEEGLRALGVYPGQEMLLMALLKDSAQAKPQTELAALLGVNHSTIAKSVRRMAAAKVVATHASAQDGRVTLVALTPTGLTLAQRVKAVCQAVERQSTAVLSPAEQAEYIRLAAKMTAALTKKPLSDD